MGMQLKELDALGKPYRIFADYLEYGAIQQFVDAMRLDSVVSGAMMPDAHAGYSLPIGGVVATEGMIYPSWVGFDIGCGMCALPTTFSEDEVRTSAAAIFDGIYQRIPVGAAVNAKPTACHLDPGQLTERSQAIFPARKGFHGLGSLGGGNHFIEVGSDETGKVWIVIHSGSRGVGHGIASEYMKLASGGQKAKEGHYGFEASSQEGQDYINDMNWGLEFALCNRREMMTRTVAAIGAHCAGEADWDSLINRNHNHATERTEREFGSKTLWIHRKGATHAEAGMMGVIPGNMRDGSFIVRGKGSAESLYSSSHGAGRVMSRKQAKEQVSLEDFTATMNGITALVTDKTRDESPAVYKSIFEVMSQQAELVEVVAHVKPIINVKG